MLGSEVKARHWLRKLKRCMVLLRQNLLWEISGARSDRPQFAKAIDALAESDVLIVTKLDRLARSTRDLLNTLDAIGKAGASFRSSSISGWADTTTPHRPLMLTCAGRACRVRATPDLVAARIASVS